MFSELLEMLKIYSTTLVAGIFCAAALSQLGLHLAAREKGTQVLCVAQGSTLGALLGVLCASIFNSEAAPLSLASMGGNLLPYAAALAGGGGTHLFCESFLQKKQVPKSAFFVAFFGLLWAVSHLVVALVPRLESHSAQAYFGDLATLSDTDAALGIVLGAAMVLFLYLKRRKIADGTFELALFGRARQSSVEGAFSVCSLLLICFSVQFLGLVFTLSALFMAPVFLALGRSHTFRNAQRFALTATVISTVFGFLVSLHWIFLPTVPCIVLAHIAVCFCLALCKNI